MLACYTGRMRKLLVSLLALVAMTVANAQFVEVPKEINDLNWMKGTWSGVLKFSADGMEGDVSTSMVIKSFGGMFQMTTKSEMMGMAMNEESFLRWEAANKRYELTTFADWTNEARVERGTMTGNKMVMVSLPWNAPGETEKIVTRTTLTKVSDNEMTMTIEAQVGDDWVPSGSATLKKAATSGGTARSTGGK